MKLRKVSLMPKNVFLMIAESPKISTVTSIDSAMIDNRIFRRSFSESRNSNYNSQDHTITITSSENLYTCGSLDLHLFNMKLFSTIGRKTHATRIGC